MFERVRSWLLSLLRVPPEPEAPAGDPRSIRIFRASRKLYYLRLVRWGCWPAWRAGGSLVLARRGECVGAGSGKAERRSFGQRFFEPATGQEPGYDGTVAVCAAVGVPAFITGRGRRAWSFIWSNCSITYAGVRLDYELRWYIVTDRSLRIRSGLWTVQESTMSFANLQQVAVSQGPLQRLLGISDVRVESAGGGGSRNAEKTVSRSMHIGIFHGVENAAHIRDLILERLRQFRETGLGDPDEERRATPAAALQPAMPAAEVLVASRQLLEEAKRLRAVAVGRILQPGAGSGPVANEGQT